jgi:hypothetical protein
MKQSSILLGRIETLHTISSNREEGNERLDMEGWSPDTNPTAQGRRELVGEKHGFNYSFRGVYAIVQSIFIEYWRCYNGSVEEKAANK